MIGMMYCFYTSIISTKVKMFGLIRYQMFLTERRQSVPGFPLKIRVQDNLWIFKKYIVSLYNPSLDFGDISMTFHMVTH